jgi:dTDP-4-amino-4,6-dideoxygalactose transaminase
VVVIEDAAPALGTVFDGRRIGSFGNTTCFSFHPRKAVTTGEGGMITTDDDALAEQARRLRAHGMSASALDRHRAARVVIESYDAIGYNYRLSDLQAAVGAEQMKKLDRVLQSRRRVGERYNEALAPLKGVQLPYSSARTPHTYQSYQIELGAPLTKSRDEVMQELLEVGIATRRGVMAIHLERPYREANPGLELPVTERASRNSVILPVYASMTEEDQGYVIEHLWRILRSAGA